jgi:hypothetical protein
MLPEVKLEPGWLKRVIADTSAEMDTLKPYIAFYNARLNGSTVHQATLAARREMRKQLYGKKNRRRQNVSDNGATSNQLPHDAAHS